MHYMRNYPEKQQKSTPSAYKAGVLFHYKLWTQAMLPVIVQALPLLAFTGV